MKIKRGLWLMALLLFPLASQAAGFDLTAGVSVTSALRFTGAAFASAFGEHPADHRLHVEPIASVGWVAPHHTHRERLHHGVFLAGGGVRVDAGTRWFVSEQLAATSTRTDALSSRLEFISSGGWQKGHFVLILRHISNGGIVGHGKNLGETMLLAGIRW